LVEDAVLFVVSFAEALMVVEVTVVVVTKRKTLLC
jgi:hypothetical protein